MQAPYGSHGSHHDISEEVSPQIANKMLDFGYPFSTGNQIQYCKERHLLLMGCFITCLQFTMKMGGASHSICKSFIVHIMQFQMTLTLKMHTKYQILDTLLSSTGNGLMYYKGYTSFATGVFHNLPWMHREVGTSFPQYLQSHYGLHHAISSEVDSKIEWKIPDTGYPLSAGDGILC